MSLFENEGYRWRETYFVLFREEDRPTVERAKKAIHELGRRYELADIRGDDHDRLDSLTLYSPADYAALDVSYVSGDDVLDYVQELKDELKGDAMTKEEKANYKRLSECNARFDVYHFEQVVDDDADDEIIDPGSLLLVLEKLARLCHGVGVDPQSGSLV